jgi:hypothetical protein
MVIDEAAVNAMKSNPAAAQEALAAGYSEYLGIEPEKIEICYTSPDVGIYGDCEGTVLPQDIQDAKDAAEAAARGGTLEEVPGDSSDSSDSSTSTSTTTGGSSGGEESPPPSRARLLLADPSAPSDFAPRPDSVNHPRRLGGLSAPIASWEKITPDGGRVYVTASWHYRVLTDGNVEFSVVFEVFATEGEDSAAAITQDLYAAGKDPNLMGQLQGAIASNLQEYANITTTVQVLSVAPVLPPVQETTGTTPPPLRRVPIRGLAPYWTIGFGIIVLCFAFAMVCGCEIKTQKSYEKDLRKRVKAGNVANLGVKEVENAASAVLEFATNMTARKNDVRSGGDKMATPGHKGGKGDKEERDLDDTSSSSDDDDDDSSLDGKAEGAGHISESATAPLGAPERAYDVFDNQLAEKKAEKAERLEADTTKESEALKSAPAEGVKSEDIQLEVGGVEPTGVPIA